MNFKNKLKKYEAESNVEAFTITININNCSWTVCVLFVIPPVWAPPYSSSYRWHASGEFSVAIVGLVVMTIRSHLGRWVSYILNKVLLNVKYFLDILKSLYESCLKRQFQINRTTLPSLVVLWNARMLPKLPAPCRVPHSESSENRT